MTRGNFNFKSIFQDANPHLPKKITVAIFLLFFFTPLLILFLSKYSDYLDSRDVPDGDPAKGMIYKGLGSRQKTGDCVGVFQLKLSDGRKMCTHGPDPAPPGVDVRKRQQPGFSLKKQSSATNTNKVAGVTCNADGKSGKRVQVLYVHASDVPDQYNSYLEDFKRIVSQTDQLIKDNAAVTSGDRYFRFVHDASCEPIIEKVVLSPTGDDSFGNTISELKEKGYKKSDRKYLIFRDANLVCGMEVGTYLDDRSDLDNLNNVTTAFALADNACWDAETNMHELGHALGALQSSAPHHDGDHPGHASDQSDILYFQKINSGPLCFDCGNDDYFSTNPSEGNYLINHWNIANSEFLGGDEDKRPKFVPGPSGDVYVVNRQGGSGQTDIHALSASSNFNDFSIHAVSGLHSTVGKDWVFALGAFYDDDFLPDIYAINRNGASGKTEVHVLSGKSNFSEFALHAETGLHATDDNWVFDVGNGPDDDPRADLFAINKQGGSGKTEIHILQGGTDKDYKDFSLHAETGLHTTDKNWDFVVGGYNDNFSAGSDIYAINRNGASGKTEIHILSAESDYKDFILHAVTPLENTASSNWSFTTGYFDNDLKADLYAINRNGASGKTEVHILSAASDFQEFIAHAASGLEPTNNANWTFVPSQDFGGSASPEPTKEALPTNEPTATITPTIVVPTDPPGGGPNPTVKPTLTSVPVPTWYCGGSNDSICSPTSTLAPNNPGQPNNPGITNTPNITENPTAGPTKGPEPCLNPQDSGFREKILDWIESVRKQFSDFFSSLIGKPNESKLERPKVTPPCIQH